MFFSKSGTKRNINDSSWDRVLHPVKSGGMELDVLTIDIFRAKPSLGNQKGFFIYRVACLLRNTCVY